MGNIQARGLAEVIDDAEGLANVLRLFSDGKLDLQVVSTAVPGFRTEISWGEARTDAARIAGGKR
jgi:hypothetical protein